MTAKGHRCGFLFFCFFLSGENVLELVMMDAQLGEYPENTLTCILEKGEFYGMWIVSQLQK